jgi:hypothetical protein
MSLRVLPERCGDGPHQLDHLHRPTIHCGSGDSKPALVQELHSADRVVGVSKGREQLNGLQRRMPIPAEPLDGILASTGGKKTMPAAVLLERGEAGQREQVAAELLAQEELERSEGGEAFQLRQKWR